MNSVVKIYKDSLILEEKNFIVDDIEDYLATLTSTITLSGFQYVKHGYSIQIKINKNQTYLDFKDSNDYNYVSIRNQQEDGTGKEKIVYYFVTKMEWGASDTIRLNLVMDTINTFKKGVDFTLSNKTTIFREHRDRWKLISTPSPVTKTFTKWTYCLIYEDDTYNASVEIKTGGSNLTVNSLTSNAVTTSYTISGGTIFVTLTNDDPFERITIVANVTYTQGTNSYQRIIDPVSEGMQSVLFKTKEENIIDKIDMRWYLVYKNTSAVDPSQFNPQNPIDLYLYTDMPINYKKYTNGKIVNADLDNGEYLEINLLTNPVNNYGSTSLSYTNTLLNRDEGIDIYETEGGVQQGAIVYKSGGDLYIRRLFGKYISGEWVYYYSTQAQVSNDGVTIIHQGTTYWRKGTFTGDPSDDSTLMAIPYALSSNHTITQSYTLGSVNCDIKSLDRTDSQIIKIIMIPYCPCNFPVENGLYVITDGWEATGDTLKNTDLNADFLNIMQTDIESPIKDLYLKTLTIATTQSRNDDNESKLLHSDFHQHKIVYDSFVYDIPLENLDETASEFMKKDPNNFEIDWHTTNTIQSRFLMKFPQLKYKRSTQVFDNILYIGRNNEMPLFSSPYFNYLRTGYNFDVKDKERAIAQADDNLMFQANDWTSKVAGQAVGAIASGSPMGMINSFMSGATSILKTINANAYLAMQLDSNIQRNLATARATAVSVSANDDVNLLLKYSPVAKSVEFKAGSTFMKAMADLFYYCGYTRNLQGNPDFNTRYWFNYVCATLNFATTINIPDDCLADIIGKFADGVTILHHHTTWDFAQEKENWEVSLL